MTSGPDSSSPLPPAAVPLRPLGPRQYAFWILQQLAPEATVANLAAVLRVRQPLRWWPLHAAVNCLVARHPALRTRFPVTGGVPLRHVSPAESVQVEIAVHAAAEADLIDRLRETANAPFDLATQLPVRAALFPVAEGGCALLLAVHHAVADARSLALLTDELARAYDAVAAGAPLPEDLRGEVVQAAEPPGDPADLAYWKEKLRGLDPAGLALPGARPSPERPTFAGDTLVVPLPAETAEAVAALRRSLGTTENLLLLTAFVLTLFRHGAGPDLVLGVPVAGRATGGAEGVGFGVSTLPLRLALDPHESFAELARRVRDVFLEGAQHASVSVEAVLAELGHPSRDWRVPLFRHIYNYRPWDEGSVEIGGEKTGSPVLPRTDSRVDLQLNVLGGQQPATLVANYSTEVHDEAEIKAFLSRMERLLRAAAEDPAATVSTLDMMSAVEREVLAAANATASEQPGEQTVCERFFAHAAACPDTAALVDSEGTVSYGELAESARRVAARLKAEGVGTGDLVALGLPRGASLAASVLGVWAVGAAYLPLDPAQPVRRLENQLADAVPRAVLAEQPGEFAGQEAVAWREIGSESAAEILPSPEEPAYVIYTSGSTGRPRGVTVTHRNLANVVLDFAGRLGIGPGDAMLWSTTPAFDISGLELCLPLAAGATVVAAGEEAQTRPRDVLDLIGKHDVAVVQATPTFWRLALGETAGDELRGRTVLCGGEPMPPEVARGLLRAGARLYNVYGPTETTIWSTVARIERDPEAAVPIGRPLANTTALVADRYGTPLPPGLLGELWIGGAGVSEGYLGLPELTAERFPAGPGGQRHYRTGDLARWRADGTLELFGRADRQVKLRGHRIELPEIEAALRSHPGVAEAAAVVVGDPGGDAELRAFVRPADGVRADGLPDELWPYLRERLPAAALPSRLVPLPRFPVSPNGKTDHGALSRLEPEPARSGRPADRPDPAPELTALLLGMWRTALGRPGLGENDHFFLNGGHSLLAARLAGQVAEAVGEDVPLRAIFDHPTARRLSARLAEGG
ncbi:non-ribosomal peptide synthetase [Amycolatopsis nivea]